MKRNSKLKLQLVKNGWFQTMETIAVYNKRKKTKTYVGVTRWYHPTKQPEKVGFNRALAIEFPPALQTSLPL